MNKLEKFLAMFLLSIPFVLPIGIPIYDSAFLKTQKREAVVEGKYEALPHSLIVNVSNGKSTTKKLVERPSEYFLNVRVDKYLHLIQTTKEIYESTEKNSKIKVNIKITRLNKNIQVENLGINPLSNEQLANRKE